MPSKLHFDPELIKKYDRSGPRYTSYPTAPQFHNQFDDQDYLACVRKSNSEIIPKSLSLYVHIPFCDTVCFYCACNKVITKDHSVSDEYIDLLEKELNIVAPQFDDDRELEQLHFGGGTPTFLNDEEVVRLMGIIRDNFTVSDHCEMSIEIDPRKVGENTIRLLTSVGFNRFSFGVQDFDEKVQQAVNRIQSFELVKEQVALAREYEVKSVNMDLIYGLPFQTSKTFSETLDKVIELRPDRLSIFNYAHLPERFKPQRRISQEDLPEPAEKLAILELCINKLQDAGYVYIGMDHFALESDSMVKAQRQGTLQRNFQGYSTHADTDLVAIGVSSISSVCDSFSQNSPKMDEYRDMLLSGKLPVVRGLIMNDEDRLRREVITQLICHFRLDINRLEQQWDINFHQYFHSELEELKAMQEEGLISVHDDGIIVEDKGRMLIRNICMVFDAYLRDNVVQFSKVI